MNAVAGEVNQMDVEYGKNFKILLPNDQIRGKNREHISTAKLPKIFSRAADDFTRQEHKQKRFQVLC